MRDVEDMILSNLRRIISVDTGIPLKQIWVKNPPVEYVSTQSGPQESIQYDPARFPAIGINYHKEATFEPNNYGGSVYSIPSAGLVTEYKPMSEIKLSLVINLYTLTRKDQREYGTKLYMSLNKNRLNGFEGDVIAGEYFSVLLKSMRDLPHTNPFQKPFIVECRARLLEEVTAPVVNGIEIGLGVSENNKFVNDVTINVNDQ